MGLMKDFDIRIRNGGDDAAGAVNELMAELQRRLLELQASMPRWIPVTERLPDDGVSVIGFASPDYTNLARYDAVEGRFWCVTGGWFNPTHWMPLPAPPTDAK